MTLGEARAALEAADFDRVVVFQGLTDRYETSMEGWRGANYAREVVYALPHKVDIADMVRRMKRGTPR